MNYENLTDEGIKKVLENGNVCILALNKNSFPYIFPIYYTYEIKEKSIYIKIKLKKEGRKLEYIKDNLNVCLFFDDRSYDTFNTVIIKGKLLISKNTEEEMDIVIKSNEVTGRSY